ncbi:MAG: indolepyruvate oxidoreductase subunit beta [Chloroflexi bacterium]|nr:indolepyruvate oxidoreductase subunit beta [Chloroflexota bacterium]
MSATGNGARTGTTNFFVAGVGGQGALLASDIIAEAGMEADLDVKKSEIHGMAQRAGSVFSHVRWGRNKVDAPLFSDGEADFLLSFEIVEALRWQPVLKKGGIAIVNTQKIYPVAVAIGNQSYPEDGVLEAEFAAGGQKLISLNADDIARELGNVRVANSVIVGVLSRFLDVSPSVWRDVLARRVPARALDVNLEAFYRGRELSADV